jgi:hypothetical protein
MSDDWDLVYDLRTDADRIRSIQAASVNRAGYGYPTQPYHFGSREWWAAIESGTIERHAIDGVVAAVYWGSMGDWPEFRVRAADGSERTWTREGDVTRYVEGLRVRVEYVTLDRKPDAPAPQLGPTSDVVIAVWLERSEERTPYYKGYRGSREPDPDLVRGVHSFPPSPMDA